MKGSESELGVPAEVFDRISELTDQETTRGGQRYLERLLRHKSCLLQARRRRAAAFQARLYARWGDALDLFEISLQVAHQCGAEFNKNFRPLGSLTRDMRFEALSRLHGNASLVASEIYQLLLGGFASGAHARWRTLHEISIVMQFIDQEEGSTAEAFLLHREVKAYEDARHYRQHSARLGAKEVTDQEFATLEKRAGTLLNKYGKGFAADYGWAEAAIKNGDPSHKGGFVGIKHLQEAVSSTHWNPYYRMANHAVHATSNSIRFNMGRMIDTPLILAGPSNAGLADPGQDALLSPLGATSTLMTCAIRMSPGFDPDPADPFARYRAALSLTAELKTLLSTVDEGGKAFFAAHKQLEREEEEKREGESA